MIAIIDYGVGNLFSLASSFRAVGADICVTGNESDIKKCERIVLPGVGAFADAAAKLRQSGLDGVIKREVSSGKPLLGICLGMQLLFEKSYEYGCHEGLSLVPGEVRPIDSMITPGLKVPHIGGNALSFPKDRQKSRLFKYINEGDHVYFVHSYAGTGCEKSLTATAEYGAPLTAAVENGCVFGTQFHPEKSGRIGLDILRGFIEA